MAEPILVEKNLDGMREGTQFHTAALAAEVGSTLALLRFEPPGRPPARAAVHAPR